MCTVCQKCRGNCYVLKIGYSQTLHKKNHQLEEGRQEEQLSRFEPRPLWFSKEGATHWAITFSSTLELLYNFIIMDCRPFSNVLLQPLQQLLLFHGVLFWTPLLEDGVGDDVGVIGPRERVPYNTTKHVIKHVIKHVRSIMSQRRHQTVASSRTN